MISLTSLIKEFDDYVKRTSTSRDTRFHHTVKDDILFLFSKKSVGNSLKCSLFLSSFFRERFNSSWILIYIRFLIPIQFQVHLTLRTQERNLKHWFLSPNIQTYIFIDQPEFHIIFWDFLSFTIYRSFLTPCSFEIDK